MTSPEIYSGKIRVRSCGLLVDDQKVLLVKQKVPTRDHLVWLPPGGGVNVGEPAEKALFREFKEETSLDVSDLQLRYVHEFIHPPIHAIELYYVIGSYTGELKKGFDPEHTKEDQLIRQVQFIHFDQLNSLKLIPEFLREEFVNGNFFNDRISYFKTHE